ncbi:LytR/AlgR family response regulator transcription factor [Zunongwangia sp.]|uniref:LytR/AlgR family response regulator transcription factor n=1 Tax=Zunongwangia sp. TaxID=1965325 RepID=UPI003AA9DD74
MKKDKVYIFTFLSLTTITFVMSYFSIYYLIEYTSENFLKNQVEASKREAQEISSLLKFQLENGIEHDIVIQNLQKTIERSNSQSGYICMIDWSGKEICHPDPHKIGEKIYTEKSLIQPINKEPKIYELYSLLTKDQNVLENDYSEIIYLYPIKGTDWIIAAHANLDKLKAQIGNLKLNFTIICSISGNLIVTISLFMVRLINGSYEKKIEKENKGLSKKLLSLSELNQNLILQQQKQKEIEKKSKDSKPASRKRILTYIKDQIVSIDPKEIAFIYMENTITYICCNNGKVYNSNNSLEEIYSDLSSQHFFRANRRFILNINAIDKIYKYGNNQLKIEMQPKSPVDILISKHKASLFKKWLRGEPIA